MLTRKDALKYLLECVFGRTDVYLSPKDGTDDFNRIIKINGNWFSRLKFNRSNWDKYCRLFNVVLGEGDFELVDTNERVLPFHKADAIRGVMQYFSSYGIDVTVLSKQEENTAASNHVKNIDKNTSCPALLYDADPFGLRTPNPNADIGEITRNVFCGNNGILFAIIVADEGTKEVSNAFAEEDIEQRLSDTLEGANAMIKRNTSSAWCGCIPERCNPTQNGDLSANIAYRVSEFNISIFQRMKQRTLQFPFPLQVSISIPKTDLTEEEKKRFYRAFAWDVFIRNNCTQDGIIINADSAVSRKEWLVGRSSGIHELKIGGLFTNDFSEMAMHQIQIPVTETNIIEYISNGSTDTMQNSMKEKCEQMYQKLSKEYDNYCNDALLYWNEVINKLSTIDYKLLIERELRDVEKNQDELKKIIINYRTAFDELSPYKKNKKEYTWQTYLIIQRVLLKITRLMQDNGLEMAQVFKDHTERAEFNTHKDDVNQLCEKMKVAGYDKIEMDYSGKHCERYKKPKKIEDVFLYRVPDLITSFMTTLYTYKGILDE